MCRLKRVQVCKVVRKKILSFLKIKTFMFLIGMKYCNNKLGNFSLNKLQKKVKKSNNFFKMYFQTLTWSSVPLNFGIEIN